MMIILLVLVVFASLDLCSHEQCHIPWEASDILRLIRLATEPPIANMVFFLLQNLNFKERNLEKDMIKWVYVYICIMYIYIYYMTYHVMSYVYIYMPHVNIQTVTFSPWQHVLMTGPISGLLCKSSEKCLRAQRVYHGNGD